MKYLKSMIVRIFQMIEYANRFFYLFFIIYTFTIYNTIKMNSNNKY